MFKKLFGSAGGGSGTAPTASRSTTNTVDAIQKLGEVRETIVGRGAAPKPLVQHRTSAGANLPPCAVPRCCCPQTDELLNKRRDLLERKIAAELERAKEFTRQKNKRGAPCRHQCRRPAAARHCCSRPPVAPRRRPEDPLTPHLRPARSCTDGDEEEKAVRGAAGADREQHLARAGAAADAREQPRHGGDCGRAAERGARHQADAAGAPGAHAHPPAAVPCRPSPSPPGRRAACCPAHPTPPHPTPPYPTQEMRIDDVDRVLDEINDQTDQVGWAGGIG